MRARRKGTKEFKEIETVTFADDNWCAYQAESLEFEQEEIKKEPISDHWQDVRERAAIAVLQGLLVHNGEACAKEAVIYADALVAELKGE